LFTGSITALVTPFKDGKVDEAKLRELVRFQAKEGSSGIVPVGTTGESPTLTSEEAKRVTEICIEEAKALGGKLKVIAGTGSYSTAKSVETTQWARSKGADAALVVCPYYNKPTQEGIYRHYKAVAEEGGLPVVIYTIPGRSVVNIEPATIARLAEVKNIAAVKEASGNLSQMSEIVSLTGGKLSLLSGDDPLTLPIFAIGGQGVISVAANAVPGRMAALCAAGLKGDFSEAKKIHYSLFPFFKALFAETNPIGIKAAMEILGLCPGELRLPMTPMEPGNRSKLEKAMKDCGVLK
jgi:4-hydroxy-tetrahydrodipicolinate synthase